MKSSRDNIATYENNKPCGKPQGIVTRNDDTRRKMDGKI